MAAPKVVVTYDSLVGFVLKRARLARGLSQQDTSAKIARSQGAVSRFESGAVSPTLRQLALMAPLLGDPAEVLKTLSEVIRRVEARGVAVLYDRGPARDEIVVDVPSLMEKI